jgi:hypothetical protein
MAAKADASAPTESQQDVDRPSYNEQLAAESVKTRKIRRPTALTVVTTSEVQAFRDCPNKHHFRYRERLRPKVEGKALAIGHIFHAGMSAGLLAGWKDIDGLTPDQRVANQIQAATANVAQQVFDWVAKVVEHDSNANYVALQEFAEDAGSMISFMLSNYFEQAKRDLATLILLEVERPFAVPVRDSVGRKTRLEFQGVRDAVFYDPTYNAIELHEHKSVAHLPEDIAKRAEMDPQTSGYMYALIEDRAAGRLKFLDGKPVPADAMLGRVAYNAVRKKRPSVPKVNKDGKVSVAAIDTLPAIYEEALRVQVDARKIPVTQDQEEKLAELQARGNTYYGRVEYQKTREEIERWRSDTLVDASRIRAANADPARRTRNPGNCNMAWSLPCEYRSVCLDDSPEIRAMFRVDEHAHPEVREAEAATTA